MGNKIEVKIEKCPIPIVWLDTSIITNLSICKSNPDKLQKVTHDRLSRIYELIYTYGRAGKIICPLAEQEQEVWIGRDDWLNTINELSLGIECICLKEIEDNQIHKAMKAYVEDKKVIELNYSDVFYEDPVDELKEALSQPFYVTLNYDIIFGAEYHRNKNPKLLNELNLKRENNVKNRVTFDQQLRSEIMGDINSLIKMAQDFFTGKTKEEDNFNAFWGAVNLSGILNYWNSLDSKKHGIKGLLSFYKSEYYSSLPFPDLTCSLFAKIMTDPQPIRSGDPMDIKHISTLMPFSDLFITDNAWSKFLNKKKYDQKYRTDICYIGDMGEIEQFFQKL